MTGPRKFYVPECFVFDSTDESMYNYPDQAVSVLWDLSDMKSSADKLADALERVTSILFLECQPDKGDIFDKVDEVVLPALIEYRGEK